MQVWVLCFCMPERCAIWVLSVTSVLVISCGILMGLPVMSGLFQVMATYVLENGAGRNCL